MSDSYDAEDDASFVLDASQADPSSSSTNQRTASKATKMATKETTAVIWQRALVLVVLLIAAVAVLVTVWLISSLLEKEDFKDNFEGAATKLLDSFQQIVKQKVGVIAALSGVSYTSYARSRNDTWPLVTINDFQQRAAGAGSLSDSLFLEILPTVQQEDRTSWEEYAVENKGWLDKGREYQQELELDFYNGRRLQSIDNNRPIEYVLGSCLCAEIRDC